MIKYFLLLFLLYTQLLCSGIIIDDNHSSYNDFEMNLYLDRTEKLAIEQIQNIKEFKKTSNSIALGEIDGNMWYHFSIKNITDKRQKRIFYLTESNIFDFDIFVIDNKKVITTQSIRSDGAIGHYPEFEISLDTQKTLDIYFRVNLKYHHSYKVKINTQKDLIDYKILKTSLLFFYFGAIASLLLYNLFIYLTTRNNNYLFYSGFVFFYLLAQAQLNTSLNTIFPSLETAFLLSTAHIFWIAFHTLFSVNILSIQTYYPRFGNFLLYITYFLFAIGFFGLYDLRTAVDIMMPFMLLLPFVLLFTAIRLYQKKNKIATFYIVAQTFFLISSFILGLLASGVLEYNYFTRYIHLLGSFSEIILFSFALAYKTKLINEENEKQKEMINDYSKLTYMGETMINIYHQWKSPLNNIHNYITHIETAKEFQDKNINNIIDSNLDKIKKNTQYLKDTTFEFLKMDSIKNAPKENLNIFIEINSVVKLLEPDFLKNKITINKIYTNDFSLKTYPNQLRNLLMILFENAINTFKNREIESPFLTLDVINKNKSITITIEDNAGGIKEKPIEKVFERYYSASDSTGLGLYLAKYVLVKNLGGTINIENTKQGAKFIIELDK